MANRVILDTQRLKISKAGFDVFTSGPLDTLFNSDLTNINIISQGQVTLGANNPSFSSSRYFDMPYGKTMRPMGFCAINQVAPNAPVPQGVEVITPELTNVGTYPYDPVTFDFSYNYNGGGLRTDRNHCRLWWRNSNAFNCTFYYQIWDLTY